jgi:hypothetical protein
MKDEIVEEIRAARRQHAEQFNYDLDAIFADLVRRQRERNPDLWPLVKAPAVIPEGPNATLQRMRFMHRER